MIARATMIAFRVTFWLILILLSTARVRADEPRPDPFQSIRFLVGEWTGSVEGQAGKGMVRRSYAFILKERYLHERNVSKYPPQEANKNGEVHEHWSIFSYDRDRKVIVLRQFHQEGFVNQYTLTMSDSTPTKVVFDSERFENFDNKWKARETYEIVSPDEFIETFELAAPGKEFEVYSRNHFRRVKAAQ